MLPLVATLNAAERGAPNPDAWPSLMVCAEFEDPGSRLDCYDKVLPPSSTAIPAPADFRKNANTETRTGTVAKVLITGWNKRRTLLLENGQRWSIREDRRLSINPGDKVEFRLGAINSINIYLNDRYLGKGKPR